MLDIYGTGLGAEVFGIDAEHPENVNADELRAAVYQNKLLVLKNFNPTPEQFLKFGRLIGEVRPYYEPIYHHPDHPEIFVSSTNHKAGGVPKTGAFWHIDYQFMPEPFSFTMTLPLEVPGNDRGTHFVDLAQAWRQVPEDIQRKVRGTQSINSPRRYVKIRPCDVYRPIGEVLREIEETTPPQCWPTVMVHPATGEEILYICEAFTEKLVDSRSEDPFHDEGLEPQILAELLKLSAQSPSTDVANHPLVHTQYFGVGDALLWDNRVLAHRGCHGTTPGPVTTHRLTMVDGLTVPGSPA